MKPVNGVDQASVIDLGANSRDQEHGKSGEDITLTTSIKTRQDHTSQRFLKKGILKTFYCLRYPACDLLGSRAVESYKKRVEHWCFIYSEIESNRNMQQINFSLYPPYLSWRLFFWPPSHQRGCQWHWYRLHLATAWPWAGQAVYQAARCIFLAIKHHITTWDQISWQQRSWDCPASWRGSPFPSLACSTQTWACPPSAGQAEGFWKLRGIASHSYKHWETLQFPETMTWRWFSLKTN